MEISEYSVIILVAVAVLSYIAYFIRKHLGTYPDYWEKQGVKCFNPSWKTYLSRFTKPLHLQEKELYENYGRVYGRYDGSIPVLTVGDPDILRNVLVKDAHIFQNRRDCQFGDPVTDNNLSMLSGDDWRRVRHILTPSFTAAKLRHMFDKVNACANKIISILSEIETTGNSVDLGRVFGGYVLDVIAICAFGTKISSLETPNNPFVINAQAFFASGFSFRSILPVLSPSLMKLFRIAMINPKSNEFFKEFIIEVLKERRNKENESNVDFLKLLLDATEKGNATKKSDGGETSKSETPQQRPKFLTENELISQCVMFFLAGYETTSSLLQVTMYNLALHQDIQERLYSEIIHVLKDKERPAYDDISEMKYLDAICCEALRFNTSCIRMDRRAETDYVIEDLGITIMKGQLVSIPFYCIHNDPEWYPEPDLFDPERFSPEARASRHQFVYLPFGLGPRSCIGTRFALMEAKLMIILIMMKFKVTISPDMKVPLGFREKQNQLVPENVLVKLELR